MAVADPQAQQAAQMQQQLAMQLAQAQIAVQTTQSSTSVKPTIDLSREWSGDLKTRLVYTAEGVNTMRTESAKPNEHFGNPFSEAGYGGTIKVPSIGAAVIAYKEWLLGTDHKDVKPQQRAWILDQINQGKLDGATLLYAGKSAARGQGMHPTALAEVVEQLRSKPTQPTVSTANNPAEYTNYSGAAIGSDKAWAEVGKEYGLGKQVDYTPQTLQKLSQDQVQEVETAYQKAVKDLGRNPLPYDWNDPNKKVDGKSIYYNGGLVRRDYLQAKAADAVFAIGNIVTPGSKNKKGYAVKSKTDSVDGGTGYAVQMAINLGKPVYVFDQTYEKWFAWEDGKFRISNVPTLTTKFAGIGTREINEAGKQAIRDVYANTFKVSTQPTVSTGFPTLDEIISGTSPYIAAFSVPAMTGNTVFWQTNKSVESIIDNIIKENKNPEYTAILKSYLKLFDKSILDRKIFASRDIYTEDSPGTLGIAAATEFIGLRRSPEGKSLDLLTENQTQTLVHELTHMLTLQPFIKQSDNIELTNKEAEFVKEIKDLYTYVKSLESSKDIDFYNAMSNEYEFIADAIADPKFRKYLNTIEYTKGKSVLSKLIEIIKKLLGVKSGTALETVIDQVYSLREDSSFKHYNTFHHLSDTVRLTKKLKTNIVSQPTVEPVGEITPPIPGGKNKLLSDADIQRFNLEVARNNNLLPKTFTTSSVDQDAFTNESSGKKPGSEEYNLWQLNPRGLYNLVDVNTGEVYLRDVDLATGFQKEQVAPSTPVDEKLLKDTIKDLKDGIKEYRLDEIFALKGYDINDIIKKLENTKTQEELIDTRVLIKKITC